jgi:hypothetical protein
MTVVSPLLMRIAFAVVSLFILNRAHAAPLERDLGRGLIYYRAANLPADLPAAPSAPKHAYVLDLRYAQGAPTAADAVNGWLKSHATPRTPVFVLANAETASAVLASFAGHDTKSGLLILGASGPGFVPDIALKVSPEAERRAYDALEKLPDADSLLKENTSKVRNDEARLSHEHLPDTEPEEPLATETVAPTEKTSPPKAPPPIIDLVLQRAVHLHRGLLGLKKI